MFTKKDLKPLMMFEDKAGNKSIIVEIDDKLCCVSERQEWVWLHRFEENLDMNYCYGDKFSITKVWSTPRCYKNLLSFNTDDRKLLLDRTEKKSVTISELCKLAGVDFDSVNII